MCAEAGFLNRYINEVGFISAHFTRQNKRREGIGLAMWRRGALAHRLDEVNVSCNVLYVISAYCIETSKLWDGIEI